jgi:hypothetical protein
LLIFLGSALIYNPWLGGMLSGRWLFYRNVADR